MRPLFTYDEWIDGAAATVKEFRSWVDCASSLWNAQAIKDLLEVAITLLEVAQALPIFEEQCVEVSQQHSGDLALMGLISWGSSFKGSYWSTAWNGVPAVQGFSSRLSRALMIGSLPSAQWMPMMS